MKDNKFRVLCGLGLGWLVIFVAMLLGAKIHPRVEQLVTFLLLGWFAFWTFSVIRSSRKVPPTETKSNGKTTENSGTE